MSLDVTTQASEGGAKKRLYCIAFERRVAFRRWKAETLYVHAFDDGEARFQYLQSEATEGQGEVFIWKGFFRETVDTWQYTWRVGYRQPTTPFNALLVSRDDA